MTGRVEISANPKRQAEFVADWLVTAMDSSPGNFRLVLAGGETPRPLYRLLLQRPWFNRVPWRRLQIFWSDERFVPRTDPDSNYGMAFSTLLQHAPIPPEQIHPIPVDGTPADAAARYEATLRAFQSRDQPTPLFDVVLLGVGADGHTASLLPESPVLNETEHLVAAVDHGRPQSRITLTYPAIASSHKVAFLVNGADKQIAVLNAVAGQPALPASRVRSEGEVVWFLDRAAAGPLYRS